MVQPTRNRFAGFARAGAVVAVVAGTIALSGCAGDAKPAPTATHAASSTPSAAPSTPTPTPTPSDPPTPVALSCDQIVTADQMYAYNPNFGADPGYTPTAGSLEASVVTDKGVACGWLNQTSNDVIEIAVAKPPASDLDGLKNSAITTSQPVPTYGVPPQVEGYFALRGGKGEVQIFTGAYWVVANSPAFQEPGDAAPLMQNVLDNLPKQ
ncbi:MAG TPA: iron ABC transporter ATP-binding protein [Diaminobutyricibacter sp.]|uniref:iron ABC transporter ATP-binding protein n=1 Tax=Leifsonia sp. McL0618 TaxID=3415677 RepID=UPI00338637B8